MEVTPFITKGCSSIREFAHTGVQSLAEATVEVVIRPKTPHKLWNTGENRLVLLCCCAPPYSHDDTVLTGR